MTKTLKIGWLCAMLLCFGFASAQAASITNADSTAALNLGASWVGGTPAGSADVAVWNNIVQLNTTKTLGANLSWAGIQILDPAGLVTISAGNTLTNGASGIDMSLATNGLTLSCPVVLGANQTWNVTNGLTLTAGGVVSGSAMLTINGGVNDDGKVILTGGNTYTGGTLMNGGIVQPNTITSFGTAAVTNNGEILLLSSYPNNSAMANALNFTGTSMIDVNNRNTSDLLTSAWSGNGTVLVTNDTQSGSTFTIGGAAGGTMANFSGSVIIVSTNAAGTGSAGTVRLNNGGSDVNFGSVNLSLDLGTASTVFLDRNRAGNTLNIGALSGGISGQPGPRITIGSSGTGGTTYSVGGKNLNTTFAGILDGTGTTTGMFLALAKVGAGTLTLAGNNTYNGVTTISAGILQIGDGVTSGTGTLGTGTVTDNATLVFARPDAISVGNAISGSGNLVQASANVLTLGSANTYGGSTTVTNGGTIQVGVAGAIPATTSLTLGGNGVSGTLDMAGNNVQVSALNTGSGAVGSIIGSSGGSNPTILTVNATNGTSVFNGLIQDTLPGGSGVVALVVQGGKLTLNGANNYSGSTTISNGTLVLGVGSSISTSPSIVLASSVATATLDVSASGGLNLPSGYNLSGVGVVTGSVTAASSVITPATSGAVGTLSFSNNLSLNGGVTINFDLSSSASAGNDQIVVGGALNLSGVNTIQISPLSGSLGIGTYKLFTCGSVSGALANLQLSGSPGTGLKAVLNVTGTEVDLVVTLAGAQFTWKGDGIANNWDYTTANWITNAVATLFADGDFVVFDDTGSASPAVNLTASVSPGGITVNSTQNYTFSGGGSLAGSGSLTKSGTGALILSTVNGYSGVTVISQGTVQLGDGSNTGTVGAGNVTDLGLLAFNEPSGTTFTNSITGSGNLIQQSSGTLVLNGNNNYSGTTTISSGTLQVGDSSSPSGTLGSGTVTDNSALVFSRPDSVTQSGLITSTGTLTQQGSGTLIVTANNNFTGGTTISSGTLQMGNGGTTGSVPTNLVDNGTLAFDHSADETYSAVISGSGAVAKLASNKLTLTGTNTYNGNTTISAGTLKMGNIAAIPNGSGFGNIVLNGGSSSAGTLDINGLNATINGLSGSSNAVLGQVVNNSGTATNIFTIGAGDAATTFNGTIKDNTGTGGKIALVKIGAGTITLDSTNSYTGGTVISNGVLATGNDLANGSGSFSAFGSTNNPVVLNGGGLTLFNSGSDNGSTMFSFANPLVVSNGQTGTLTVFERGTLSSALTGSGTLNVNSAGQRCGFAGNWSAFTGTINLTGNLRMANTLGYSNAVLFLNDGADLDGGTSAGAGTSGSVYDIGELGGTSAATIGAASKPTVNPVFRVGWKNTINTFAGTIENAAGGVTSIVKVGTGTWYLSGQNTYSGSTTISNGVLALTNNTISFVDGEIGNSTNIFINAGAFLDVSGLFGSVNGIPGSFPLNPNQILSGNGTIRGVLDTTEGGTVSPGGGTAGSVGTLTITNSIDLGGTAWMKLNRAGNPNSDRLISSTASIINYGGTLVVTNIGANLQVGDTFTLFTAGTYNNSFGTVVLPNYYTWDTSQLAISGKISVTGISEPSISSVDYSGLAGGSITLNATNGLPNGVVIVLTTTNLALPTSSWTPVTTNNFDGSGNLNLPITVDPTLRQSFYLLQVH